MSAPIVRGVIGTSLATAAMQADLLLLAGDLTRCGSVDEIRMVVDELSNVPLPTIAVLGNHDLHSDQGDEITEILEAGGITVLDRSGIVVDVRGVRVGVAGAIGFGGGFDGATASDFGEREMKSFVERSRREADGLAEALADLDCATRIALTHYSPIAETLGGRALARSIRSSAATCSPTRSIASVADLALHGHAHRRRRVRNHTRRRAGPQRGDAGDPPSVLRDHDRRLIDPCYELSRVDDRDELDDLDDTERCAGRTARGGQDRRPVPEDVGGPPAEHLGRRRTGRRRHRPSRVRPGRHVDGGGLRSAVRVRVGVPDGRRGDR